jgi:glycosyltransferase involved in cell wall biosynthesis
MKMKIAQIIDSLSSGGAERLQVTFAETAMSCDIRPTVIVLANYPNTPVPEQLRATGAEVVEFCGRNLVDPLRFIRLTLYLRSQKFDILHAHLGYAIILGVFAGLLTGTPVVATLHNILSDRWTKLVNFMLWLGAKRIIAVGEIVMRAHLTQPYRERMEVVVNPVKSIEPVPQDERDEIRTAIAGDKNRPFLIAIGRLEPQKAFSDLISAMVIVQKSRSDVFLAVVGGGSLGESIDQQIVDFGLQADVKMLGVRADVPRLLASSDFFVSSSHWEGMPIAVLEAMSAGLPIVATKVGDVPHIIGEEHGILVEPGQPFELANAILTLLDKPDVCINMGRSARSYVSKHHDVSQWFNILLKIYEKAAQ